MTDPPERLRVRRRAQFRGGRRFVENAQRRRSSMNVSCATGCSWGLISVTFGVRITLPDAAAVDLFPTLVACLPPAQRTCRVERHPRGWAAGGDVDLEPHLPRRAAAGDPPTVVPSPIGDDPHRLLETG